MTTENFYVFRFVVAILIFLFLFYFASNIHAVHKQTAYLFISRYLFTQTQPVQVYNPSGNETIEDKEINFQPKTKQKKREEIYVAGERSNAISLDNALWEIRI